MILTPVNNHLHLVRKDDREIIVVADSRVEESCHRATVTLLTPPSPSTLPNASKGGE